MVERACKCDAVYAVAAWMIVFAGPLLGLATRWEYGAAVALCGLVLFAIGAASEMCAASDRAASDRAAMRPKQEEE